jgi:hypothetical protein
MTSSKTPQLWSLRHPPVNRQINSTLGATDILLAGATASIQTGPDVLAALSQTETLALGPPRGTSSISGEPGYLYQDNEVTLYLTLPELYRFLRRNLEPKEYFALVHQFGVFYAISGKWYDEETGRAASPTMGKSDQATFVYRCMTGEVEPEAIDDEVDAWHTAAEGSPTSKLTLRQYLGMREDEYVQWMKDSSALYKILFYRMRDFGV